MGKMIRWTVTALPIVAGLLIATVGAAAEQTFEGVGEWRNVLVNPKSINVRAKERAEFDARKKSFETVKEISRTFNSELNDEEVSAVVNNVIELVGKVQYETKNVLLPDKTAASVVVATLKAKINTDEVLNWLKRSPAEKSVIIRQNNNLQEAIQKNYELTLNLTEQYIHSTSSTEKDKIRHQLDDADKEFLALQKLTESNKLFYQKNKDAVKPCDEALKFKPNYFAAYNSRGLVYKNLKQYERAIQDFDKALELKPNYELAYYNRGIAYSELKKYRQSIQDMDKVAELNPNIEWLYVFRAVNYFYLEDYQQALADLDKAMELNPNLVEVYQMRGYIYFGPEDYQKAFSDFSKVTELKPNDSVSYKNRGDLCRHFKQYEQAIQDYDKAIELGIEGKNFGEILYYRGLCYQATGDEDKAQVDFAKAKELGYEKWEVICTKKAGKKFSALYFYSVRRV